jgi:3-(3-hydroxy-phenyl)propionate hydroxylase
VRQSFIPELGGGVIATDPASGAPTAGAGELFPQPDVMTASGEVMRMDHVLPDRFVLVTFAAEEWIDTVSLPESAFFSGTRIDVRPTLEPLSSSVGGEVVVDMTGLLVPWACRLAATVAVVRPDKYVYGTAATLIELQRLLAQLDGQLAGAAMILK